MAIILLFFGMINSLAFIIGFNFLNFIAAAACFWQFVNIMNQSDDKKEGKDE